jgi:hypothetical protein
MASLHVKTPAPIDTPLAAVRAQFAALAVKKKKG